MDPATTLKSLEIIASAVREVSSHLRDVKLDDLVKIGRGASSAGPLLLIAGSAAAIGVGVGILMSTETGAAFRSKVKSSVAGLLRRPNPDDEPVSVQSSEDRNGAGVGVKAHRVEPAQA